MNTKISSFNLKRTFEFYKVNLKRSVGFGSSLVFFAGIFLIVPYIFMIQELKDRANSTYYLMGISNAYNDVSAVFVPFIFMVGIAILTLYLFSFIHSKIAVDVYHSLPVKRSEIFIANLMAVMTYVIAFLILFYLPVSIYSMFLLGNTNCIAVILTDLVFHFVVALSIFSITAFACVNVGTVIDSIIYTLALVFGFLFVYIALTSTIVSDLEGFYYNDFLQELYIYLSTPILFYTNILNNTSYSYNDGYISYANLFSDIITPTLVWIFISIGLIILSIFIYKRRKSEKAQTVGEIGLLQLLIRTGGAYIGGVGLTYILRESFSVNSYFALCIITLFSTLLIFALLEIILNRSVAKMFKNMHIGAILAILVTLLTYSITSGFYGYADKVPDAEKVVSVEFYSRSLSYGYYFTENDDATLDNVMLISEDETVIENIIKLHQNLVDTHDFDQIYNYYTGSTDNTYVSFQVAYHLENGTVMTRSFYQNVETPVLEEVMINLISSEDFLSNNPFNETYSDTIFGLELSNANINSDTSSSKNVLNYKDEFVEALYNDIMATSTDTLLSPRTKQFSLYVSFNENCYTTIEIYSDYEKTIELIDSLNLDFYIELDTDNINKVVIASENYDYGFDKINIYKYEIYEYGYSYTYDYDLEITDDEVTGVAYTSGTDITEEFLSMLDDGFDELYTEVSDLDEYDVIFVYFDNATSSYFIPTDYFDDVI